MVLRSLRRASAVSLLALSLAAVTAIAPLTIVRQQPADAASSHDVPYVSTEMMVPVRDGVKLHIIVSRPDGLRRADRRCPS